MKVVVKNDEYTIYQRRDGRHAVEGADKKPINGDDKVTILAANELIAVTVPAAAEDADAAETETEITKADDPEPVTDAPADESGDDAKAAEDE